MKVWLIDFEKFIKVNGLQPVTNANMFDMGNVPSVDGLFSTEIFGVTTKDRKETMAYIDLGGKFLNPKVYITTPTSIAFCASTYAFFLSVGFPSEKR